MRTVAGLLVAVALVAGCGGSDASGDLIAFDYEYFDGDFDVFVMNPDGTEVRQLTDNAADDRSARWSPDGKRIAFGSDRDGDMEVFVMNADGTQVRQVTDNQAADDNPVWSPDGKRIAFDSDRDGDYEVFVMNADGTQVRQVTDNQAADDNPVWSPDGKRIAFESNRLNADGIFVMQSDGSSVRPLASGQRENYLTLTAEEQAEVDRLQQEVRDDPSKAPLNTSKAEQIYLNASPWDGSPAWSPDGKRIAFVSFRDGDQEVFVMNADGTQVRQLTDNQAADDNPVWSPDGKRIAFTSNRYGSHHMFVMDADGSNVYSTGEIGWVRSWGG